MDSADEYAEKNYTLQLEVEISIEMITGLEKKLDFFRREGEKDVGPRRQERGLQSASILQFFSSYILRK